MNAPLSSYFFISGSHCMSTGQPCLKFHASFEWLYRLVAKFPSSGARLQKFKSWIHISILHSRRLDWGNLISPCLNFLLATVPVPASPGSPTPCCLSPSSRTHGPDSLLRCVSCFINSQSFSELCLINSSLPTRSFYQPANAQTRMMCPLPEGLQISKSSGKVACTHRATSPKWRWCIPLSGVT